MVFFIQPASGAEKGPKQGIEKSFFSFVRSADSVEALQSVTREEAVFVLESAIVDGTKSIFKKLAFQIDLLPQWKITVGAVHFYIPDLVLFSKNGRLFLFLIVKIHQDYFLNVYYRSNSQGTFRFLPGIEVKDDFPIWYDKGLHESTLEMPGILELYLSQKVLVQDFRTDVSSEIVIKMLLNSVAQFLADDSDSYKKYKEKSPVYKMNIEYLIQQYAQPRLPTRVGKGLIPPDQILLINPLDGPDFSHFKRSYMTETVLAGKVWVEVFASKNEQYEWTFFKDEGFRIWISKIERVDTPIGFLGLRTTGSIADSLNTPRWEYCSQSPQDYRGQAHPGNQLYCDLWQYLKKIDVIQRYYLEHKLDVPQ